MSIEGFHDRLRRQASNVVLQNGSLATLAVLEDKAFVAIEPEFAGTQVVRGFYVDRNHRGQGVGKKIMSQITAIAEEESVILVAYVKPFELFRNPGRINLSAQDFGRRQAIEIPDFDGTYGRSMRNLLRACGFGYGFDPTDRYSKERTLCDSVYFGYFDTLHAYIPESLEPDARAEFIDRHKIGTDFPVLKLSSILSEKFDHLPEFVYKLRGKDAYMRVAPIGDYAGFQIFFMKVAFVSGNDAGLAIQELQNLATVAECGLIGVTAPTASEQTYRFDKGDYELALRAKGFEMNCPIEFLGEECSGEIDFQLLWLPTTLEPSLIRAAELLSDRSEVAVSAN